ncbi:MAG: J domain-containing protein [Candidatus Eremiobacterota bacterium]
MEFKDYYKTLGVAKGASPKEVKQAYRRLARQFHPDVNKGDKASEARFREINEAYEVLSDEEKRRKYDQLGMYWNQPGAAGPRGGWSAQGVDFQDLGDLFGGGGGSGFSSFFEHFFGGARRGGAQKPRPVEAEVEVSLEEAIRGTTRSLTLEQRDPCGHCGGAGITQSGICPSCRGQGALRRPRNLEVKIPAGVADGSKIRLRDENLLLTVRLLPDPVYDVKGHDLHREVPVPVYTAVLGGKVDFPTPRSETVGLKIPPRTQSGRQFRLTGQGLPRLRGEPPGDLYVKVRLEIPADLTPAELELFEHWARLRSAHA